MTIRARRRSQGRPPARAERLRDGSLRLDGRHEWLVAGEQESRDKVVDALAPLAEDLGATVLLRFGNGVGWYDGGPLGRLEVRSGKWSEDDFDGMLRDLSAVASNLPFGSGGGASPFERRGVGDHDDALLHRFAWLRYVSSPSNRTADEALIPALRQVVADPHRKVVRISQRRPVGLVSSVGAHQLHGILSGRYPLEPARGLVGVSLARRLRGALPAEIEDERPEWTVDTPENRFVKAFLDECASICSAVRGLCDERQSSGVTRLRSEAVLVSGRLEPFLRSRLWQAVGRMELLPGASTVLQSRRGYRGVWSVHVRMRQRSRLPRDLIDMRRLLEIRDIAELYELWCFFRMVAVMEQFRGPASAAESFPAGPWGLIARHGFRVAWSDGAELRYNQSFGRGNTEHRSYSVVLRPDILLRIPAGPHAGLHLFDAKFRYAQTIDGGESGSDRRRARSGDLHKMHAYRDAIPEARSVWVLHPGSEEHFFACHGDGSIDGVGAMVWRPGMAAVSARLTTLLSADGAG